MRTQCDVDATISTDARDFATRRAAFRLSRFSDQISDVRIVLKDVNGPKGGVDIRCLVWVRLTRGNDVIIQEQAETFEQAVGNALDRANRNVARESRKLQTRSRRSRPKNSIRRNPEILPAIAVGEVEHGDSPES